MAYNPFPKTQSPTVAGRAGRVTDRSAQTTQQAQHPSRRGVIVQVLQKSGATSMPFVKVRWLDSPNTISGWIPLDEHPMSIATLYASRLEDLVGQYTVRVKFRSAHGSSGVAKIVPNKKVNPDEYDPQLVSTGVKIV